MRKFFQTVFIIGFLGVLIFPLTVKGDGGFFPPPDFYLRQTQQKAVILYDEGVETLIISVIFQGDAKDFGWVVPTPSRPEIDEAPDELFVSLEELTGITRWKDYGGPVPLEEFKQEVEVLETKEVGIFEAKLLKSDDPKALANWLAENNYQFPKEGSYVLESYVENNWYFVAVKVRPDLVWGDATAKLQSGHATPIKLTFEADKIVYPLKISSLNKYFEPPVKIFEEWQEIEKFGARMIMPIMPPLERKTGILLYVFADKEKKIPGFDKQYAQILKPPKIENLAYDEKGNPWFKTNKDFVLTRLERSMSFSEMTYDLVLRDAVGGLEVVPEEEFKPEEKTATGEPSLVPWAKWLENGFYFLIALFLWVVSPVGLIFLFATAFQFLSKLRLINIVAWFFQGLSILLWILAMVFLAMLKFAVFTWYDVAFSEKALNAGIVAGAFLMVVMLGVMIWQIIWRKKKQGRSPGMTASEVPSDKA